MMTASGRLVLPGNDTAPSLEDIALGLSRLPRFGGQCRVEWTVLDHSLLVGHLMATRFAPYVSNSERELHGLLHDAHEAITGDVPTPWKTAEVKQQQAALDRRLYDSLHIPLPSMFLRTELGMADRWALIAEADEVGPYDLYAHLINEGYERADGTIRTLIRDTLSASRWRSVQEKRDTYVRYVRKLVRKVQDTEC
jgi:5'-deoxynucleotidase YfbR-like HD superfamily hydrolase